MIKTRIKNDVNGRFTFSAASFANLCHSNSLSSSCIFSFRVNGLLFVLPLLHF